MSDFFLLTYFLALFGAVAGLGYWIMKKRAPVFMAATLVVVSVLLLGLLIFSSSVDKWSTIYLTMFASGGLFGAYQIGLKTNWWRKPARPSE